MSIDFAEGIANPAYSGSIVFRVEFHSPVNGWHLHDEFEEWDEAIALFNEWADTVIPARIVEVHTRVQRALHAYHDPAKQDVV